MPSDSSEIPVRYKRLDRLGKGYLFGTDGSVWSKKIGRKWRRMKTHRDRVGYHMICFHVKGRSVHGLLHRFVLEAFVGPCPDKMQGCHNNGNKDDNRIANLRWDTARENARERYNHHLARLTDAQVLKMRRMFATGKYTMQRLADIFGINLSSIHSAVRGKSYIHVGEEIPSGVGNLNAVLTERDIRIIRYLYDYKATGVAQLADIFGVTTARVSQLVRKRD